MNFYRIYLSTVINLVWVGRPQCMNLFFVLPEGIWVEESPWTGRAEKLHTQVVPVHIGADGHMRDGRFFMAPLNPATPLSGPNVNTKGCHVGRDGDLQGLRTGQRGSLLCQCIPLSHQWQGFWISTFRFLGCGLDTVAGTAHWCLLAGGRAIGRDEWEKASQRRPYRSSALDQATASSTFWRPTASKQLASLQRKVACCNKHSPWKERGDNSQNSQGLWNLEHG